MYTKETELKIENQLLATHLSESEEFKTACYAGDSRQVISIVEAEMTKNNLFTKGSMKLKADIIRMLQGRTKVSYYVGENIVRFVYNSRLSGIGLGVCN